MNSTLFCAISTIDGKETWTCPVAFAFDEKLNLYFISMPSSRHMKNIVKNSHISVAIFSTKFAVGDPVFGIQMTANAKLIPDEDVETAYDCYYGRKYPQTRKHPERTIESHMGTNAKWKFVKIKPIEMHYVDTRHFGEERQSVPKVLY